MVNSMPPSNIKDSITVSRKRALESPPPLSPSPALEPDIAAPKRSHHEFDYISGLTARERVDRVFSQLSGEHRWTIKDLIYYAATAESSKKYAMTARKQVRDISNAIFDKLEVVDALSRASDHLRDNQILNMAQLFQKELRKSQSLSKFNAKEDTRDLNIPGLVDQTKGLAPGLWHFLQSVIEPGPTKGLDGALLMIFMILAYLNAPRTSNTFHILLGIHLHSMGVKRDTINLLAKLGITVNYQTVINHTNDVAGIAVVSLETLY